MNKVKPRIMMTGLMLVMFVRPVAQAATNSYVGLHANLGEGWRSVNVAKTAAFDPDGDNAYGSDGYYCTFRPSGGSGASGVIKALPSYISSVVYNTSNIYSATTYVALDNPTLALSSDVANMGSSGMFYYNAPGLLKMFTIVLAADADFLLSTIVDIASSYMPTKIKVVGPSNESEVTGLVGNLVPDFVFFRITGSAGDTFVVWMESAVRPGSAGLGFEAFLPTAYPALDENHGETWRSTNIKKPKCFDPNGDQAYGSDGYYCPRRNGGDGAATIVQSLPSYISSVAPTGLTVWGSASWRTIDDPTVPIGNDVTNILSGSLMYKSATTYTNFFTITLAQDADCLLSIILDVFDATNYPTSKVKVIGPGATNEITGLNLVTANGIRDYVFFRIIGREGDSFKVWFEGASTVYCQGLGFEAIPPPKGFLILIR